MGAKEKHRIKIIEYIGDWENDFPTRVEMAKVCGVKPDTLRKQFTPAEYTEMENEGLELRKKQSAIPRAEVYAAMHKAAVDGVVPAQKEFLDRTEGKVTEKHEHGIDKATLNAILAAHPNAEAVKKALIDMAGKK